MARQILLTGATGALGLPLIGELLRHDGVERIGLLIRPGRVSVAERFERLAGCLAAEGLETGGLFPVVGDLSQPLSPEGALRRDFDVIVHAAADTRFRAPHDAQNAINVEGTRRVLQWARTCPRLSHVVLVSTTCVAGSRSGSIAEESTPEPPRFINHYEKTKWQAEWLALQSGLPIHVVRLSTCLGNAQDGRVARPGAIHHSLRWLYRGLVPMIQGAPGTPVDLIPTETAVRFVSRAALLPPPSASISHVAAGARSIALGELVDFLVELFRETHAGWRRGQIARPLLVDRKAFDSFRSSVERSRDALLGQVMEAVESFLPALLDPKTFETEQAEQFWGGPLPLPEWRPTLRRVFQYCLQTHWAPKAE